MQHITYEERQTIERLYDERYSLREIARHLGRHHRTVQQELRRNKGIGPYEADTAQRKYLKRLYGKKEKKLDAHAMLRQYVIEKLQADWSPEQVSERLKRYDHRRVGGTVSHETIYQFVYSKEGRFLRLFEHLRMGKPRRWKIHSRRKKIPIEGPSIHERPWEIAQKKVIGHWESDLMECQRKTGHVSSNYERASRLCRIERVKNKQAEEKYESLVKLVDSLPQPMVKSITFDRGTENAWHQKLNEAFGVATYLCDPYASWQKGGVENLNKLLRQYIPKKSDLSRFTDEQLYEIQERLNNRPRKALDFFTPNEFSLYHKSGAFNT